jgi:hypothetical protein
MCLVKQTKTFICVSLCIFNKTAKIIIAKPTRTKDKTDCCLCILQNTNPARPPRVESDPSFLSRTSFPLCSHIFFTENQRVFLRSFVFWRSSRMSSKVRSLVWNITFSKNSLLPSSGYIWKTAKGSTTNETVGLTISQKRCLILWACRERHQAPPKRCKLLNYTVTYQKALSFIDTAVTVTNPTYFTSVVSHVSFQKY